MHYGRHSRPEMSRDKAVGRICRALMGGSFKTEGHSTGAGETLAVTTAPQAHKDAIAFSEADARRGRGTNISEVVVDRPPVRFRARHCRAAGSGWSRLATGSTRAHSRRNAEYAPGSNPFWCLDHCRSSRTCNWAFEPQSAPRPACDAAR